MTTFGICGLGSGQFLNRSEPPRVADNPGAAAGGELLAAPRPRMRGIGSRLEEHK